MLLEKLDVRLVAALYFSGHSTIVGEVRVYNGGGLITI